MGLTGVQRAVPSSQADLLLPHLYLHSAAGSAYHSSRVELLPSGCPAYPHHTPKPRPHSLDPCCLGGLTRYGRSAARVPGDSQVLCAGGAGLGPMASQP